MIINCRKREALVNSFIPPIKLSSKELKLLLLFSDNYFHSYIEISNYLYNNPKQINSVRMLMSRLCKRFIIYNKIFIY